MKFVLPKKYIYLSLLLISFMWLVGAVMISAILLLALGIIVFLSRVEIHSYQEDLAFKENIFFSPVNGKVLEINDNKVTIVVPWWRSFGIYLPIKSEVETVTLNEGKDHFRFLSPTKTSSEYSSIDMSCIDGENTFFMSFTKCHLGFWPQFQIMPGDRGKSLVLIGHFPMGGSVTIQLPECYESSLEKGSSVVVGETILASKC